MAQGAFALVALMPLALRARRRAPAGRRARRPCSSASPPSCRATAPPEPRPWCRRLSRMSSEVVLVDDGAPDADAAVLARDRRLAAACAWSGWRATRQGRCRRGRGGRAAVGAEPPDALIVVDADGQHPPDRIPEFVAAAADADVVIGDRRGRPRGDAVDAPLHQRDLERTAHPRDGPGGCWTRSAACASTGVEALERAPLPPGRYEAETRHLRAAMRAGLRGRRGCRSRRSTTARRARSGRSADTWRVLGRDPRAAPPQRRRVLSPGAAFARRWAVRFALLVAGTLALAALACRCSSRSTSASSSR